MRWRVVDSQCHVSLSWYEPVESLLSQMDRHGVEQAVLVQMLGETDNEYQQQCLARFPGRFASVVLVDPTTATAIADLTALSDAGATGVRLRPSARSPGADPLAIWRAAMDLGMAVSCVGNSALFLEPEFERLIEALPRLSIVLEHLGGSSLPDADELARSARARVRRLARFPNVYMKVPGLGELVPRHMPPSPARLFADGAAEVLDDALRLFGPNRLMWGSDFPPVSAREGYGNALSCCQDVFHRLPKADLHEIFCGVAARVFRLPPVAP